MEGEGLGRHPEGGEGQRRREDEAARVRRIIEEGTAFATAHDQEIDDWVARHIAIELSGRRGSAVDSLASTGEITAGLRFELLDGYPQQSPTRRRWIDFLGTYYIHRQDQGPAEGWAEQAAVRDRFEEAWQVVHGSSAQRQVESDELARALGARQREAMPLDDDLGLRLLVAIAPSPYGAVARYAADGVATEALTEELAERYTEASAQLRASIDQLVAWTYARPAGTLIAGRPSEAEEAARPTTADSEQGGKSADIPELLPDYGGEGYDWMEHLPRGWAPVAAWGRDGWDLGSWPYAIVVEYGDPEQGVYAVGTYVENDITVQRFETADEQYDAIDTIAEFYWRADPSRGPRDLPEGQGLLPHHRRPYRRSRADEQE